jgi:hypothetical protein
LSRSCVPRPSQASHVDLLPRVRRQKWSIRCHQAPQPLSVAAREHKHAGSKISGLLGPHYLRTAQKHPPQPIFTENKSHKLVGFSVFATEEIVPELFEMNAFPAYSYPTMKMLLLERIRVLSMTAICVAVYKIAAARS